MRLLFLVSSFCFFSAFNLLFFFFDNYSGCISFVLVLAVYVVYWYGPTLRKRSPFAQQLSDARAEMHQHMAQGQGVSQLNSRANSFVRSQQNLRIRQTLGSRQSSYIASRGPSQANSRVPSQANSRVASRRNSLS